MSIVQTVAHAADESILCVRVGYAALPKFIWCHFTGVIRNTAGGLFCCIRRPNSNLVYCLSRDARTMLARCMPSLCVRLCGVDVAY